MNKSQRSVSSKDLTVDFTREEWQQLCPARRLLDRAVILENYRQLVSVGYHVSKPDVIFKLGQGEEPWIVEEFSGQNYPEAPTKRTSWYSTPQAPQWECHRNFHVLKVCMLAVCPVMPSASLLALGSVATQDSAHYCIVFLYCLYLTLYRWKNYVLGRMFFKSDRNGKSTNPRNSLNPKQGKNKTTRHIKVKFQDM
uniref:zinc finger protein 334 isoform X5 n=1 Tax=Halichoerus grypus TaxID=9711 RepID=UPI001659EC42|nr:zinc finger protein 334 isoform X5 [Halichoerus grypus]